MTRPRAVFLLGKGGVGKTTCALALARTMSRSARVLALSLDQAHNLGDLSGEALGPEPRTIAPGLEACEPDLEALARRRADEAVDLLRSGYRYLDALSLSGLADLVQHAPGLEEQSAVDALAGAVEHVGSDGLLVVDMPPTGSSVRMLVLPALGLQWISCLSGLRKRILDRRSAIAHVRGREALGDVPLEEDGDPVTATLAAQAAQLEAVAGLVTGGSHVLVAHPEPLSLTEAGRIRRVLVRLGTDASCLVINRSGPPGEGGPAGDLAGLRVIGVPDLGPEARDPGALDGIGRCLAGAIG